MPYTLLCDPAATLIAAIGLKKAPKGTTRGVFVINKEGKVLASEPGGPAATVEVVRKLVKTTDLKVEGPPSEDVQNTAEEPKAQNENETADTKVMEIEPSAATNGDTEMKEDTNTNEDAEKADVAADVADSAEKLDKEV